MMLSFFTSITESLATPSQRHAMLAHFPIVLSFMATVLMVFLLLARGKSAAIRRIILATLLTGGLLAWLASNAGSAAMNQLQLPLTAAAQEALESHESMGQKVWIFFIVAAAFTALSGLKFRLMRYPSLILAMLALLLLTGWVMVVAHDGGSLVYRHGTGVPTSPNNVNLTPP